MRNSRIAVGAALALSAASSAWAGEWRLVVSDPSARALFALDPVSGAVETLSSEGQFVSPEGIAVRQDGLIYVIDRQVQGGAVAKLFLVDPSTGSQTVISTGGRFMQPYDVAVSPSGKVFIANGPESVSGQVLEVDPVTGSQTVITSGGLLGYGPLGITSHPNGFLYVTSNPVGGGVIVRIDPVSGAQTLVATTGLGVPPVGIDVDGSGMLVVTTPGPPSRVIEIDPETGAQRDISVGGAMFWPVGVVSGPDGRLFVADQDTGYCLPTYDDPFGAVIAIDPASGAQSPMCWVPGHLFFDPIGIDVLPGVPVQASSTTWGRVKAIYR